jgi:Protein of unknown function (DUF433)
MPVPSIFENLEAGANIDDIMEWFDGLDRDQVRAVIEFAARSLNKPSVCTRRESAVTSLFFRMFGEEGRTGRQAPSMEVDTCIVARNA